MNADEKQARQRVSVTERTEALKDGGEARRGRLPFMTWAAPLLAVVLALALAACGPGATAAAPTATGTPTSAVATPTAAPATAASGRATPTSAPTTPATPSIASSPAA